MFEIEIKELNIQGQLYKKKFYDCVHCGAPQNTIHGYRINCTKCFKWNPVIADLMHKPEYRLAYHMEKEKRMM